MTKSSQSQIGELQSKRLEKPLKYELQEYSSSSFHCWIPNSHLNAEYLELPCTAYLTKKREFLDKLMYPQSAKSSIANYNNSPLNIRTNQSLSILLKLLFSHFLVNCHKDLPVFSLDTSTILNNSSSQNKLKLAKKLQWSKSSKIIWMRKLELGIMLTVIE